MNVLEEKTVKGEIRRTIFKDRKTNCSFHCPSRGAVSTGSNGVAPLMTCFDCLFVYYYYYY